MKLIKKETDDDQVVLTVRKGWLRSKTRYIRHVNGDIYWINLNTNKLVVNRLLEDWLNKMAL